MSVKDRKPLVLDGDGTAWERQAGETAGQFAMFQKWLDLPHRSPQDLAKVLDKSVAYLTQCAWAGRWRDRAERYDVHQVEIERARRRVERRKIEDQHLVLARAFLVKSAEALKLLDPADMKPIDIVRMVEAAAKLQRAVLDMPESTLAVTGQGGGPVALSVVGPMSETARVSRLGSIAAELARRAGHDVDPSAFDAFLGDSAAG